MATSVRLMFDLQAAEVFDERRAVVGRREPRRGVVHEGAVAWSMTGITASSVAALPS